MFLTELKPHMLLIPLKKHPMSLSLACSGHVELDEQLDALATAAIPQSSSGKLRCNGA